MGSEYDVAINPSGIFDYDSYIDPSSYSNDLDFSEFNQTDSEEYTVSPIDPDQPEWSQYQYYNSYDPSADINSELGSLSPDDLDNSAPNEDVDPFVVYDAYTVSTLPGADYDDNLLANTQDWVGENIDPTLVRDPWQWAQENPWTATGIGVIAAGGAAGAYYMNGEVSSGWEFDVGDGGVMSLNAGFEQDDKSNFNYEISFEYEIPF
jgi:hypothetical protein